MTFCRHTTDLRDDPPIHVAGARGWLEIAAHSYSAQLEHSGPDAPETADALADLLAVCGVFYRASGYHRELDDEGTPKPRNDNTIETLLGKRDRFHAQLVQFGVVP